MGMPFLDKTEAPANYRHQLQMLETPTSGPLQLCGLGNPRRRLYCLANADGGLSLILFRYLVRKIGILLPAVLNRVLLSSSSPTAVDPIFLLDWIC